MGGTRGDFGGLGGTWAGELQQFNATIQVAVSIGARPFWPLPVAFCFEPPFCDYVQVRFKITKDSETKKSFALIHVFHHVCTISHTKDHL